MTKDTITAKATGVFAELMSTSKPDRCVAIIEEALTEIATLARKEGREEAVAFIRETVPPYDEKYEEPRMYIDRDSFERILQEALTN